MSEKTITLTLKQHLALYDALIYTVNMMPQMLDICTDGKNHSDTALYNAMEQRKVIEQKLREALNER